ncbi:MAG: glycosyltransferase family 39 protein [Thermoanaerobaculia bacterium]
MRSRWLLLALVVGLVARLAFEIQLAPYPRHERMRNALDDQAFFVDWSAAMARGARLDLAASPHEWAFWAARQPHLPPQAPLYPALLALLSLVVGSGPGWIRLCQVAAGLATIVGVFLVARQRFGEAAAGFAALGAALYAPWIFFEATVLRTSGLVLLFVAIVVALDRLVVPTDELAQRDRPSPLAALGVGALFGLAILFQEQFLLLWIGSVIWLVKVRRGAARWLIAGAAAVFVPLVLWASLTTGRLVAATASAPFNLLIANLHDADGQVPATTPTYDALKAAALRTPNVEVDLVAALARDLAAHPRQFARLVARKFAFLLRPVEISNNVNFYLGQRENPTLRWIPFDYPTLLPLALAGLVLTGRWAARPARPAAPLGTLAALYGVSLVAFVPLARLRQPLAVLVIVLAGAGAEGLWRRLRATPPLAIAAVGALLVAGSLLRPEPLSEIRPTDWQIAGGAWENEGRARWAQSRAPEARAAFLEAWVRNPLAVRAQAAVRELDSRFAPPALAPLPAEAAALCEAGVRQAQQGDYSSASRTLERATRLAPGNPRPWQLLSNTRFLRADRPGATVALEQALALAPFDEVLAGNLAFLRGLTPTGAGTAEDWTPGGALP